MSHPLSADYECLNLTLSVLQFLQGCLFKLIGVDAAKHWSFALGVAGFHVCGPSCWRSTAIDEYRHSSRIPESQNATKRRRSEQRWPTCMFLGLYSYIVGTLSPIGIVAGMILRADLRYI